MASVAGVQGWRRAHVRAAIGAAIAAWLSACSFGSGTSGGGDGEDDTGEGSTSGAASPTGGGQDDGMPPSDGTGGTAGSSGAGDSGEPEGPGPWHEGWIVPAEPQTDGDPEAGYHQLLHNGYLSCGIPYSMWGLAEPFMGAYAADETLPERQGKNADMPYDWTVHVAPSGVEIASQNCLQCHAGRFNGELVIGLGVADRDFTESQAETIGALPVPDPGFGGLAELAKFTERVAGLGPNTVMRTVGSNPAEMAAISLVSHRDPDTLAWSEEPWFDVPPIPVPSDVPPWWRAHKKNALFYNAMARGDHRGTMILATALCTDDVDEAIGITSYFNNIHAFVRSLRPPAYPFAIDEALAAQGEPVFEANCAPCHGTYAADEADETFPNLLLPLDVVGTDPVVAEGGTLWAPELVEWYNASYYGSITRMEVDEPFVGYLAPPLDGVWATGPFLHNGSVPNIALVLDSEARPRYWRRVDYDSENFDPTSLGWPYVELDHGQDGLPHDEAKHIYDTTQFGHGNGGHTFGDHLSDAERTAVIEYLKTL
jgi:hypothetical protein